MIKVENIEVFNFEGAIRGMRNPMNSWNRSDSYVSDFTDDGKDGFVLGKNDLDLMQRLYKGGPVHAKYLRQLMISMDIVSHHAWWAEFDTYKVGTTRNSCSKMHKIHVKEFTKDDFSHEGIDEVGGDVAITFGDVLCTLEMLRQKFNETNEKKYWRAIIELLPTGYNIRATVTMNYANVMNMLDWRTNHKLDEWVEFCGILRSLPYVKEIRGEE